MSSTPAFALSINPATGEEFARYPIESHEDIDASLNLAVAGYRTWSAMLVSDRAEVLRRLAKVLRADIDALAALATNEMGKPIAQAKAEVEKCAGLCDWYAEHGPAMLNDESTAIGKDAYVSYLPIGAVLAVMPWNFPFWQVLRGAVPILLGGNAYVLKHAPNVMGCAYALRSALKEAGLPDGAFSVLNASNDGVSMAIADRRIAAVAVTGSVRAGSAIASQAGAALKKSVLELGGADPFIVLADADLDGAVKAAVTGRFQNNGQICIAAKRIILEKPIAQAFTEKFVAAVKALKVGNPMDPDTYVGPMARFDLRDELAGQVQASVEGGATLLLDGGKQEGKGNYFAPVILSDVRPGMVAFDQELFGPVASLIVAEDEKDALALANHSEFGLSGAIWTTDREKGKAFARRLETGGVFVNGFPASDPRIPIGGIKHSGYGRELSHFGMTEFLNAQTVWVDRK
jgi:succinate-semialdehyde dehydrogenase